jgi:uncharacterized protein (TIGR03437 family)
VYVGTQNSIATFGLPQAATPGGLAVVNAASYNGAVAPGSIVALFGIFGLTATPAEASPLPYSLASASVRVNGVLAPLYYSGDKQINAQVPYETAPGLNTVVVSIGGRDMLSGTVSVAPAAPGLFLLSPGQAAVTNENGTVNGPDQPAAVGTIISAYLTGQGAVDPPIATGAPAPLDTFSRPTNSVSAFIAGQPADVTFAGLAPTLVGVFQVNLRVPQVAAGQQSLSISVGGVSSNASQIFVRR